MAPDLIERVRIAYDRCKLFPETSKDGFIALLELRNLMPDVLLALEELRDRDERERP